MLLRQYVQKCSRKSRHTGFGSSLRTLGLLYHKSLLPLEIFVLQFGLNTANAAFSLIHLRPKVYCMAIHSNFTQIPLLAKIQTQRSDMFHSTKLFRLQNPHSNIWYTSEVICRHSCVWASHKGDTLKKKWTPRDVAHDFSMQTALPWSVVGL